MRISNKCSIAVHCLLEIYENGEEEKMTSEILAQSTGSNPVTVRSIVSALKKDGVLKSKGGTGGAVLGCAPEEISLYRICAVVEPEFLENLMGVHSSPSEDFSVGRQIRQVLDRTYQKVEDDLAESLKSVTMQDVVTNYHAAT